MHRLLCLGQLSLTGADGQPVNNAAAQPRRLALLALLGRSAPRAVSRERLIAWFWSEADEERARRSLNQALYALRSELGSEDVLLGQRDLRLNLDLVGCDAADFEAAIESGRLEDAAALYRGPFADGFHLPAAPEFNQWLEEERRALAHRYLEVLESLAVGAERRGDPVGAVGWWRRAANTDPASARLAVRLMRALEAAGDRPGAIRHAAIYESIVQQQLDLPPDPSVLALAEELRTAPPPPVAPAAPPPAATAMATAPAAAAPAPPPPRLQPDELAAPAPPVEEPAPPRPRTRRRRWTPAVAAALAVGTVLIAPRFLGRRTAVEPGGVSAGPPVVAVLPFENRTGDSTYNLIGSAVTDWVTGSLAQTGLVRVMDTRTLLTARENVDTLATRSGAAWLVTGRVFREADSLIFRSQIVDAATGQVASHIEPVAGSAAEPTSALTRLEQRVMGALAVLVDPQLSNWRATSSRPPTWQAYGEFLLGIRDFGRNYDSNFAHFARAAALDTSYSQARLWAGISLANLRRYPAADSVFRGLAARRDRMAPYDRASLDYFYGGFVQGDWETSYRGARTMAELAPLAGHALWAHGLTARMTGRPREAIAALERLDLSHGFGRDWAVRVLGEIARSHHVLGQHEPELAAARRMVAAVPGDGYARTAEAVALAAGQRYAELARRVEAAMPLPEDLSTWEDFSPGDLLVKVANELRAHGAPADTVRRYAEAAVAWYAPLTSAGDADTLHLLGHARAAYAAGRWDEAARLYGRLVEASPASPEYIGGAGAAAARLGDTARAEAALRRLAELELPYPFGRRSRWSASIAAALGRRDDAVRLLSQSRREGLSRDYEWHSHPDFIPLADYPPFRELIRPHG